MGGTSDQNDSKDTPVEEIPLPVVGFSTGEPPIVLQPILQAFSNGWMDKPEPVKNCPPGLEYLTTIDELYIHHQKSDDYQYYVTNNQNEKIYQVKIISEPSYWRAQKEFALKIFDNSDKEVINISHPFGCESCFCCCFLQKVQVFAPPGTLAGALHQEWNLLYPTFAVRNQNQDITLRIEGPFCQLQCCSDIDFKIITPDGKNELGKISKTSTNYANGNTSENNNFELSVPMDLDVRAKAVLLSACFLIDLIYLKVGAK